MNNEIRKTKALQAVFEALKLSSPRFCGQDDTLLEESLHRCAVILVREALVNEALDKEYYEGFSAYAAKKKPIVRFLNPVIFTEGKGSLNIKFASVFALDHPKLGSCQVNTSEVLLVREDGSFETRNTQYVPYMQ